MQRDEVCEAYGAWAAAYADRFGAVEDLASQDRHAVLRWARGVDGPVVDVGCGPGQWTALLHEHGITAHGLDPVTEFVAIATERWPGLSFARAPAHRIPHPDRTVGGVLAWFSLIHLPPTGLDLALAEFTRVLTPQGALAIGFFEGPRLEPFAHAVAPAFYWPVQQLIDRVQRAGFLVEEHQVGDRPGERRQGRIFARLALEVDRSPTATDHPAS